MIVEVMLNQDSILDFPKVPHILSFRHSKYQSWISVYTFKFQNGHGMTSPAYQLANKKVHRNSRVIFQMANTQNMWTF